MRIAEVGQGHELHALHHDTQVIIRGYDEMHRLQRGRDRNGNEISLSYDAQGHLAQVTDAAGRVCQFNYDAQGRLVTITGLQHPFPLATFEYEGALLVRVRDPAGAACEFGYDTRQLLVSITDPDADGAIIEYHPTLPVVLKVTTTDGAERRIAYDQPNLETTVTDQLAAQEESVVRYTFDTGGRCVSVTDGPLLTTHNTYDIANNLLTHTDADGHVTTMTYSAEGDLLSVQDPTQAIRSYTYDPIHRLVMSVTDEAGNTWSGQRDSNGNLTRRTDPLGNHDDFTYDTHGLLASHTDRRGNTTTFGYNANGDLISLTDASGKTISATYNPRGIPVSITDQENHTVTAALTPRDEIASVTLPGGELYTLSWTASRMLASISDPRNATISWQYNDRKQVVARTDPMGFTTNLIRDGAGFAIRAVNALGNATHYDRDLAGRLIAIRDPDGGVVSFLWGCCDILSRTDALGTQNYSYTSRHQLAGIASSDVQTNYNWDPRGLLAAATQSLPTPAIGYTLGRDAAGRTTSIDATHLGPRITTLVLDAEGNPTQVVTNLNPTPLVYTYNNLNLPASVTAGSPPLTANLTYTPRRQIAAITYSSGVGASYGYNPNRDLTTVHYQGASFMADYSAGYDASGNRSSVHVSLPPPLGSGSIHVDYELRGLPTTVNYMPGGVTTIAYNQVRDRVQLAGPNGSVAYTYSPSQRMIGAGQTILRWNLAGGCTLLTQPTATTAFFYRTDGALQTITRSSQSWQIVLGPLGEIARVTLPGGGTRWFAHDFADRSGLLRRVIMNAPGAQVTDSFVFTSSTQDRAAAPGPVGTSAAPLMWLKSPPVQINQRAPLTDPWGSIALVADGSGNMLQARVYGIFGEILAESSNPPFLAQGFLAMEVEEGLGNLNLLGLSAIDYLSRDFQNGYAGESTSGGSFVRPPFSRFGEIAQRTKVDVDDPFGRVITRFAAARPYLAETGSFLYDAGFGPDGLYGATRPLGGPGQYESRWFTEFYGASWDASGLVTARNRPLREDESDNPFRIQNIENDYAAAMQAMADAVKKLIEALREAMQRLGG
jgi:YD repeat-containing protein